MKPFIIVSLFVAFLWGLNSIVIKRLLSKFNYYTILFFTYSIMFICVLLLCYSNKTAFMNDLHAVNKQDIAILTIVPIFVVFIGNYLYYTMLKTHESSIISALVYSAPIFTLILAHIFTNERLTKYGMIGVLMVSIGIIMISMN